MTAVSYGTEGSGAASAWEDDGGRSVAGTPEISVAEATALAIPDGLDWAAFSARCFPGRQRHDFEAVKAYEAYGNRGRPPSRRPPFRTGS
jgi:hypothetical protein